MEQNVTVGRRKTSVARVFLRLGTGKFIVNGKELNTFFGTEILRQKARSPFATSGISAEEHDVIVNVNGGGITGQADSIRLGLSRALIEKTPETRPALKKAGFLTRDPRMVERKKFGKRKARRSTQFSKR
jgi:small subunit ribosomal protein S9